MTACRRLCAAAAVAAATALLVACAGAPPPPDWALNARSALAAYQSAYLRGESRVAEIEFARARDELARTGNADAVAHAELVRCALRTASLDFDGCPGFVPLAADAGPRSRAYAAYLAGDWQGLDPALLPEPHREVLARGGETGSFEQIPDPLSRLVAAGVLLRAGRISPAGISAAVGVASAQGWRRPLLAWLGVQEQRALAAGDSEAARAVRRRIELVTGGEGAR